MRLHVCKDCCAVQVTDKVPADVMFRDYFYFSSSIGTLRDHFKDYAADVTRRFLEPGRATVLEFGCNDGVLLRPLADQGIRTVIGVDPASNVVATINDSRITVINDYFTEDIAMRVVAEHGKVDLVMANNVYAHIPDIQGTTRAVAEALDPDGVFAFEVHYLGKVIDELQYDMIYHEHCNYYSLLALENFFAREGMEIFDTKFTPGVRSGAVRFYARHQGGRGEPISPSIEEMRREERASGFDRAETYCDDMHKVAKTKEDLLALLDRVKSEGKRVIGYGASGRGTAIMNYCGIDGRYLDYVVDDAQAKHGFFTPGTHVKIEPWARVETGPMPDYALLFAWSFFKEVMGKRQDYIDKGGKFIVPLPEVKIVPS
jgi:SAM-dependent methyltransferase